MIFAPHWIFLLAYNKGVFKKKIEVFSRYSIMHCLDSRLAHHSSMLSLDIT